MHPLSPNQRRNGEPRAPLGVTVTALGALAICSGCAVNGTGLVVGRVMSGQGAEVVEVYALGGILRTDAFSPGLTVGGTKATLIYPVLDAKRADSGWWWLHVPLPKRNPVVLDLRAVGVDLSLVEGVVDLTLGLRRRTILARVPVGEQVARHLFYDAEVPERTRYENLATEKLQ
jgi:hypothetical protein